MHFLRARRFRKDYLRLSAHVQTRVDGTLERFESNSHHPSLQVKKMEGSPFWEMRVSDSYRITFQFVTEGVLLRRVGTHNILRNP